MTDTVVLDAPAALLLDAERLSAVVGQDVRATSLRRKPGLSTSAALVATGADGLPRPVGWVRVATASHRDKTAKARTLAAERGRTVEVTVEPEDGLHVAWGGLDTDPRLIRSLDRLDGSGVLPALTDAAGSRVRVLRYNPLRRLVVRVEDPASHAEPVVVRVTARSHASMTAGARALAAAGVPVLAPLRADAAPPGLRPSSLVSISPWVADTGPTTAQLAHALGEAVARLHALTPGLEALAGTRLTRYDEAESLGRSRTTIRAVRDLDPRLGLRAEQLLGRVGPAPGGGPDAATPRLLHGDLSLDQAVLGPDGVRVLDLDRLGVGHPDRDLGSFVASELLRTGTDAALAPFLQGYGRDPGAAALRPHVAHAVANRLVEPFREGRPDWHGAVVERLDLLETVVSG